MGHPVGQGVGVTQKLVGPLHLPLGDEGADIGGGDGDAILLHLLDDVAAHAQLPALLLQALGIALAHVAKVEVVSGHHMDTAQLLLQIFRHKVLPVHLLHPIKGGHDDLFNAVIPAHQPHPVLHRAEQGDGLAGDGGGGAAVKSEGAGHGPQPVGRLGHRAEQGPVTLVYSVKKPQGNNTFRCTQSNFSPLNCEK